MHTEVASPVNLIGMGRVGINAHVENHSGET